MLTVQIQRSQDKKEVHFTNLISQSLMILAFSYFNETLCKKSIGPDIFLKTHFNCIITSSRLSFVRSQCIIWSLVGFQWRQGSKHVCGIRQIDKHNNDTGQTMARPEFIPLVKVYYHSMLATIFSQCIDINKNDKNIQKHSVCYLIHLKTASATCISSTLNLYFIFFLTLVH